MEVIESTERVDTNPNEIYEDDKPHFSRKRDFSEVANIACRRTSFNLTFDKKKNTFTIVIPYDETEKKYSVKLEEVDFLDSKEYIFKTIENFNQSFRHDKFVIPMPILILLYIFYIAFFCGLIYSAFLISLLCIFNPLIILVLILGLMQFTKVLVWVYFNIRDWYRGKMIKAALNHENMNSVAKKLSWQYGKEGAWLELLKREEKKKSSFSRNEDN
jgi:hypothetical protein